MDLQANVLRFECRAQTEIVLPPFKGSTMRGALFSALRRDFCQASNSVHCSDCPMRQACPVCALLATKDEESVRGVEVARPCTIEPPLESRTLFMPGDTFTFGLTLFGETSALLPYVVIGARRMGEIGIGNRYRAKGSFAVQKVSAADPLTGEVQLLHVEGDKLVRNPAIPVTHDLVLSHALPLGSPSSVSLELLTPTRLVLDGSLVKQLTFTSFLRRLLRRLTDLTRTATGSHPGFDHESLLSAAEAVPVVEDRMRWVDVASHSSRTGRATPIGGLIGQITFEGDLKPFVPWLLWGAITHIGKDATKGGGWYRLRW